MSNYEIPAWVKERIADMFVNAEHGTIGLDGIDSQERLATRLKDVAEILNNMATILDELASEVEGGASE